MLRLHHRVQNSPWSLGVSSPNSCTLPAHGLGDEEQKRPLLCVRAAQQELKPHGDTNFVFSTNPNHSPIPATRRKLSLSQQNQHTIDALKNLSRSVSRSCLGNIFWFFLVFFFFKLYLLAAYWPFSFWYPMMGETQNITGKEKGVNLDQSYWNVSAVIFFPILVKFVTLAHSEWIHNLFKSLPNTLWDSFGCMKCNFAKSYGLAKHWVTTLYEFLGVIIFYFYFLKCLF